MSIARKSTSVKTPEEAQELLDEVERFIKPGELKQNERIEKIAELASKLYGIDTKHVSKVVFDNREMLESFNQITSELQTLAQNLKHAEEQRQKMLIEQAETAAKLEAARAETAAAQAAEETRRLAEVAARLVAETAQKSETTVHMVKVQESQQFKEKSPALEFVEIEDVTPQWQAPVFTTPLSDAVIQEGSYPYLSRFVFTFFYPCIHSTT